MKSYDNTICRDVLSAIDDVTIMEQSSGIDVISSLIDVYDKGYETFSNYEGSSSDAFKIFGESFVMEEDDSAIQQGAPDKDANAQAKKKEDGFFYKLIHFIPNLLSKLWNLIKNAWNGKVVPAANQAVEKAGGISGKVKDIMDKIRGKEPSWVKEHHKELGIGAGALGVVLAWLAYVKRNDIAVIAKKWLSSIKGFFKQTKELAEDVAVIFEQTVGNNIKTNFNIKNIGVLFKQYIPDFFKAVREYLNSTKGKKINTKKDTEIVKAKMVEKLNGIVDTPILLENPTTYSASDCIESFMGPIDDALQNDLKNECEKIVEEMKNAEKNFTNENLEGDDESKGLFKKTFAQVLNNVKNLISVISSTVTNFSSLFKKIQENSTEELKVVNALANDNGDDSSEEVEVNFSEEESEEEPEEEPKKKPEEKQNDGATEESSEGKPKEEPDADEKLYGNPEFIEKYKDIYDEAKAKYIKWRKSQGYEYEDDKHISKSQRRGAMGEILKSLKPGMGRKERTRFMNSFFREFAELYRTYGFDDVVYQEAYMDVYYDDEDDDNDESSSWYNR